MGVYIKDEKMPDTCIECFKHNKCDRYHIEILKNEDGDYMPQYVADNCPLIEVKTPHGRLIDADSLMESFASVEFSSNMEDAMEILDNYPTIIEAEESE